MDIPGLAEQLRQQQGWGWGKTGQGGCRRGWIQLQSCLPDPIILFHSFLSFLRLVPAPGPTAECEVYAEKRGLKRCSERGFKSPFPPKASWFPPLLLDTVHALLARLHQWGGGRKDWAGNSVKGLLRKGHATFLFQMLHNFNERNLEVKNKN